jgi:uncharacterized phage protein (TIGR01671 family)
MRTVKFRGKRIDNKEWVYGYLYELPLPSGEACMILTQDNNHVDNSLEPKYHLAFTLWVDLFLVDPATVGQFTGLTDKNGKEIYEDDIISSKKHPQIKHLIFYNEKQGKFMAGLYGNTNIYDFGVCGVDIPAWMAEKEVIGNIHDNPGLIEKGGEE